MNGRARSCDLCLAANLRAVFQVRDQTHIVDRRRIDVTLARKDFGRQPDSLDDITRDLRERCQKEIAEAMTAKLARAAKAMTKETREKGRVFGERDHTVAYVARREHLQLFA